MYGTYETIDGRSAVRFERRLPHPATVVWDAVSAPEHLARWFPVDVEPGPEVASEEAPRERTLRWGEDELRFTLEPVQDGDWTCLGFAHLLGGKEQAAREAAGWTVCLDRLTDTLEGADVEAPGADPTDEWRAHYERYVADGVPAGAPLPPS